MNYREEVQEDYNKLTPYNGAKKRASDIYGITGQYFRQLLANEGTQKDVLMQMQQAIKQSASEVCNKAKELVEGLK